MNINRRSFTNLSAFAAISGLLPKANSNTINSIEKGFQSLVIDALPISISERKSRIEKAQKLLIANKMDALILDCSTSLTYFTGVEWWPSERTMVAIIPATGEVKYVCPAFEHDRLKEQITIGKDIYIWQEDESPYGKIVNAINDASARNAKIGMDEQLRFFIMDGIHKIAPKFNLVSGDPITIPCRMIKSEAEINLMQKASDITLAAIKFGVSHLKEGMSQQELSAIITKAQNDMGGHADFALCLFGESSAFPHGSKQPKKLKKGDIVLMDCGCVVHGYSSDISRTVVFGAEPTNRQMEIWNLEKEAQEAGFAAAKIGAPCEAVDAAARKVITDAGFGPNYKLPGLPHRTGHGIGMDGHEWGNMVRGNKKLLEPGMCFSIEPTISIMGEFGVRLEDCVYMTAEGPKWFSQTSKSIYEPFS